MNESANPGSGIDNLRQQATDNRRLDQDPSTHRPATAAARASTTSGAPETAPIAETNQFDDGYSREFADHPGILKRIGLTLLRGLLMAVFFLLFEIINYTIFGIAILQYLVIVLAGRPLGLLRRLNEGLSAYMGDIAGYLTCVDDRAPFPFSRLRGARGIPLQPEWRRRKTDDDHYEGAAGGA